MNMQVGEVLRRWAFYGLDALQGGKLNRLKEVNKREIVQGVTPEYIDRRIEKLLDYARVQNAFRISRCCTRGITWNIMRRFPVRDTGIKGKYIP